MTQNFAKSPPYFWLALHRTKVRWRFRKILWPSQNTWTLTEIIVISLFSPQGSKKRKHWWMNLNFDNWLMLCCLLPNLKKNIFFYNIQQFFNFSQYPLLSIFIQNSPKVYNMICDYFNFFLHFSIHSLYQELSGYVSQISLVLHNVIRFITATCHKYHE